MAFFNSVPNDQVWLLETCGKYSGLAHPGFLCLPVPCVQRVAGTVSKRIHQLDVSVETKTKDNAFVQVQVSVHYAVQMQRIYEAHYRLSSYQEQLKCYVFDVVRSAVPQMDLDAVFRSKDDIAGAVKDQLKTIMEEFGFAIVKTLVTDISPDPNVKAAMNEINASKRNRISMQEKAEADKILKIKTAEAEAESKFLQGEGIGRQQKAIVDGLRESVSEFNQACTNLKSKDVLDLVLITQYFDTLKELGQNSSNQSLIIPHNPGSLSSLAAEIRAGVLQGPSQISRR